MWLARRLGIFHWAWRASLILAYQGGLVELWHGIIGKKNAGSSMMRMPSDNEFLRNIVQEVYSEAVDLFQESLVSVILFGSYARGDYDEYSDVDFMFLVNLPSGRLAAYRKKIAEISSRLSLKYDRTVSLHLQDNDTVSLYGDVLPYLKNVMEEGIIAHAG